MRISSNASTNSQQRRELQKLQHFMGAANVGTSGLGLYDGKSGLTLNFRTLVAGAHVTLALDDTANTITVTGATWAMSNVGTSGVGLYDGIAGTTFNLRNLVGGANVTLTLDDTANTITIAAATYAAANVGTLGYGVYDGTTGTTFNFRHVAGGAYLTHTLDDANNNIVLALNLSATDPCLESDGGGGLRVKVDGTTITRTASGLTAASAGEVNWAGLRNKIINGAMDFWQRVGSAATTVAAGTAYTADRWQWSCNFGNNYTLVRATSVPTNEGFTYSFQIASSGVPAAPAAGSYRLIEQKIEGYNFRSFFDKTVTLRFWMNATAGNVIGVSLYNNVAGRSCVTTVTGTGAWAQYTVSFPIDTGTTSFGFTNTSGLQLRFCLGGGTTFQTATTGAWQVGNLLSTSAQTQTPSILITGVELLEGTPTETWFDFRDYAQELALCQRYYTKSFSLDTQVRQNSATYVGCVVVRLQLAGANASYSPVWFHQRMRATPTLTFYSPSAASSAWYNRSRAAASGASSTPSSEVNENGFTAVNAGDAADLVGNNCSVHWSAEAEL